MVKDNNGNIYTYAEMLDKRINELQINIKDTKTLAKRIDDLVVVFLNTKECKQAQCRLEEFYEKIKRHLPEDTHKIMMDLDDFYTEILIMYKEYFYKRGYYDGRNSKGLIQRLKEWFSKR